MPTRSGQLVAGIVTTHTFTDPPSNPQIHVVNRSGGSTIWWTFGENPPDPTVEADDVEYVGTGIDASGSVQLTAAATGALVVKLRSPGAPSYHLAVT